MCVTRITKHLSSKHQLEAPAPTGYTQFISRAPAYGFPPLGGRGSEPFVLSRQVPNHEPCSLKCQSNHGIAQLCVSLWLLLNHNQHNQLQMPGETSASLCPLRKPWDQSFLCAHRNTEQSQKLPGASIRCGGLTQNTAGQSLI
jgi:hypothetical protein